MEYYKILNLTSEPFSNTPDPDFFYRSKQHLGCLQKIEISLRLRRGLNVIVGEVGTGKTTLCRQIIRSFAEDVDFLPFLILDPVFRGAHEFLTEVAALFKLDLPESDPDDFQLREAIKNFLFEKGVTEGKTTVLIIDEGQKIPSFALEILRGFLNFETNDQKLLQIVIFAQNEFEETLKELVNFSDRISLFHRLGRLNFRDAVEMVNFRIRQASQNGPTSLHFTLPAMWTIYRISGGRPRGIINICHLCILSVIIQNRSVVTRRLVKVCAERMPGAAPNSRRRLFFAAGFLVVVIIAAGGLWWNGFNLLGLSPLKNSFSASETDAKKIVEPTAEKLLADSPAEPVPSPSPRQEAPSAPAPAHEGKAADRTIIPDLEAVEATEPLGEPKGETATLSPPEKLGSVTIKSGDTIGGLVKALIGSYGSKYLGLLRAANPELDSPNTVKVGQILIFPAVPMKLEEKSLEAWWIDLGRADEINKALLRYRTLKEEGLSVRIIPFWSSRSGLVFSVARWGGFDDEASAMSHIAALPPEIQPQAHPYRVVSDQAIFFADPMRQAP